MNEIVKICKIHGELTKELIHPKGKSPIGKQYYGCLLCKKEVAKKFKENNPNKIKEFQKKYHQKRKLSSEFKLKKKKWNHDYIIRRRKKNGDELRAKERVWKKNYVIKNKEKIKERYLKASQELKPYYIRGYLKNHYGFENPTNELVYAKSTIMMLRREIMAINVINGKNKYVKKTRKYDRRVQSRDAERKILSFSEENIKKS